ncbi:MAG: 2-phytyl-1,4-naphtoquinone methyltransferase [Fimbriimonadaceae bacterium]|nr:2-phytyl-1,4-naphtoquinone methyltransferase [Fimbriimonadaceae bacterium]
MTEQTYTLGTHDEEIDRLGLQHRVWRACAAECWSHVGIDRGWKVMDIGAGPGFVTTDLAELVDRGGKVAAFERSARFVDVGRARCAALGLANVDYHRIDLVEDKFPVRDYDAAWCRWVMSFVSDPKLVIEKVHAALRPGGRFALHEYLDYCSWKLYPHGESVDRFVDVTIETWRANGGEPNIAQTLPNLLVEAGFRILRAHPIVFTMRPGTYVWNWPAAFIANQGHRTVESGHMTPADLERVNAEMRAAERDPNAYMISPIVLELIAERD